MNLSQIRLPRPSPAAKALTYAGLALLTGLTLAACGPSSASGNSAAPPAASTPAPTGSSGSAGAGGGAGQRQPGVTGLIAAVNGSTMQVQTRTDQTAVTWTGATTFTKVATATLADVTVGSCVTVLEPPASGSASATSAPAAGVTAASIDVRPAVNGDCAGFGGGFGGGAPGAGRTPPAGAPTGPATTGTGARGGAGAGRRAVAGLVSSVSGDTITVQESVRARGTASSTATASPATTTVSVTATAATTFTAQQHGSATDVAVGQCATALGKADDTGAVAATAITLRPATNGSCTAGFGGGRGGATGTATTAGGLNG